MSPKNKIILGWTVLIIINIIPVIFWFFVEPISERFVDFSSLLTSLGQVLGLVGMSLFATVIFLSARLKIIEDYFQGLNRIYLKHHLLGGLAFVFLLFHPLSLALSYALSSLYSAVLFILPSLSLPAKTLGGASLGLMFILLVTTYYFSLKYPLWKLSHKFLGLAFLLGFLHMILIPSDVSRHPSLLIYMSLLSALAFWAIIYRSIFARSLVKKYAYTLTDFHKISYDIVEITLKPVGQKMVFLPGQFAFFSFQQSGLTPEFHPFSFISSPEEETLKIAVKALGDFTASLAEQLKVGSGVEVEGPYGRFLSHGQAQIWLAGGIGVTPFMSMLSHITPGAQIDFYWSVVSEKDILWRGAIEKIAGDHRNFRFFPHVSTVSGHLTAEIVNNKSQDLFTKEIFICGPPSMMRSLKKQLIDLGVDRARIHTEEFSL